MSDTQIKELEESINLNWKFKFKTSCEKEHYQLTKHIERKQKKLDKLIRERNIAKHIFKIDNYKETK